MIELLVVIAILGILAALLLPAFTRAKDSAIPIKCLSNVKQFDLAILNYGSDNHDHLPAISFPGRILDDYYQPPDLLQYEIVDALMHYGLTRDTMYDPGNSAMNNDVLWSLISVRMIGYVHTFPGLTTMAPTNQNPTIFPQAISLGPLILPPPDSSRRVLVAGVVMSPPGQDQTDAVSRASYDYITSVGQPWPFNTIRTSHLDSHGKYPTGDNAGMLDGSAHWTKFNQMVTRVAPGAQEAPGLKTYTPYNFWW